MLRTTVSYEHVQTAEICIRKDMTPQQLAAEIFEHCTHKLDDTAGTYCMLSSSAVYLPARRERLLLDRQVAGTTAGLEIHKRCRM